MRTDMDVELGGLPRWSVIPTEIMLCCVPAENEEASVCLGMYVYVLHTSCEQVLLPTGLSCSNSTGITICRQLSLAQDVQNYSVVCTGHTPWHMRRFALSVPTMGAAPSIAPMAWDLTADGRPADQLRHCQELHVDDPIAIWVKGDAPEL